LNHLLVGHVGRYGTVARHGPFNRARAMPRPSHQPVGRARHNPQLKHVGLWPVEEGLGPGRHDLNFRTTLQYQKTGSFVQINNQEAGVYPKFTAVYVSHITEVDCLELMLIL
jgi:hypothetical protein